MHHISVKPVAVILGWNSHINFPSESFLLAHISSHVTNMNQSNLGLKKVLSLILLCGFFLIVLPFILLINFISEEICLIKESDFFFFFVMYFIVQLSLNENASKMYSC